VLPRDQQAAQALRLRLQQRGPERLMLQVRPHPDYSPAAMARDPELEATVRAHHQAAMARVQASLSRDGFRGEDLEPRWALPFPLMVVQADAERLDRLLANTDVQIVFENVTLWPSLADTQSLIGTATAHAAGATGSGRAVAVLDTGVESSHPMFSGKIPTGGAICWASDRSPYSGCPSGIQRGIAATGAGEPCTGFKYCDHGTHVAGIAIGNAVTVPPNGPQILGTAVSANLISVRVAGATGSNQNCTQAGLPTPCVLYHLDDTVEALAWIYNQRTTLNIAAVNMSYGTSPGPFSQVECTIAGYLDLAQAAEALATADVAVVAASGNSGLQSSQGLMSVPACLEHVTSVAAVDKQGAFAPYSSVNGLLDLLAPGGDTGGQVLSAVLQGDYKPKFGTSMAAPHVAGAYAALKSLWPTATRTEIIDHLKNTGLSTQVWYGQQWQTIYFNKPRIRLDQAVATPSAPSNVTIESLYCYGANLVQWTAPGSGFTHFVIEGSLQSNFSNPFELYSGPNNPAGIDVTGTTWIRVRACSGPSCGASSTASTTAGYVAGCL
jgi:subtilisin family serine protease